MRPSRIPSCLLAITATGALALAACGGGRSSVQFGAVLPLTGEDAVYGEMIRNGIDLALEQAAADSELGFDIAVTTEDSAGDPDQARQLAEQLYGSSLALIGGVTSREALAMVDAARTAGKILLSPSASSTELSGIAPGNFFRIYPTSAEEAVTMMNFTRDTLQVEDIVLVVEDTLFGRDMAESYKEAWQGEVKAEVVVDAAATDYSDAVAEVMASGSKTAVVAATGGELARLIQSLRDGGFAGQGYRILTNSAIASQEVRAQAGEAAWGVYFTMTQVDLDAESGLGAEFAAAYEAKYGARPDVFAAYGYDAFNVLVQALRESNATAAPLPSEFLKGMRSISNFPGVTGSIQFRESGDVQQFERIFYISEGQVVDFDSWWRERQEEVRRKQEEIQRRLRELTREQPQ